MLDELFNEFNRIFSRGAQVSTYKDPFGRGTWRTFSATDSKGNYLETRTLSPSATQLRKLIYLKEEELVATQIELNAVSYDMKDAVRRNDYEQASQAQGMIKALNKTLAKQEKELVELKEQIVESATDDEEYCNGIECSCRARNES